MVYAAQVRSIKYPIQCCLIVLSSPTVMTFFLFRRAHESQVRCAVLVRTTLPWAA